MAADLRKKYMNTVIANLHGRGLIVREINMTNFRKSLPDKADLLRRHLSSGSPGLKSIARMVVEFQRQRDSGALSGLCSTTTNTSTREGLSSEFVRKSLAKGEPEGFRDDAVVAIAYTMARNGENWAWVPVGVAVYGEAATKSVNNEDVTFADAAFQSAVQSGKIIEIDLLCAKGADAHARTGGRASGRAPEGRAPPGTGSLLLHYCLARSALRKKGTGFRYNGAVLLTAANQATSAMGNVARKLGFVQINATIPREPGARSMTSSATTTLKNYLKLHASNPHGWVSTLLPKLADLPEICRHGTKCQ